MVFLECIDKDGNTIHVRANLLEWFGESDTRHSDDMCWFKAKFSCFDEPVESNEHDYFMNIIIDL